MHTPLRDTTVRPRPSREVMRACTRVSRWRTVALLALLYGSVVALAWLGGRGSGWWLALPAFVVIAGIQNNLLILQHEGAHGLIHPSRRVNDLLTNVCCAIPFGSLLKFYRRLHLMHHKHGADPSRDPEVQLYAAIRYRPQQLSRWGVAAVLLRDLSGLTFLRVTRFSLGFVREQQRDHGLQPVTVAEAAQFVGVWGALGGLAWVGLWPELLAFWLLPLPTLTTLLSTLHGYGEHTGARGGTEYERTWTHAFGPLTNFFLYPLRSGYHLEHHLFPRVPWYHVDRLREELARDPEFVRQAAPVTVDGYLWGRHTLLGASILRPARPAPPVTTPAPVNPLTLTPQVAREAA